MVELKPCPFCGGDAKIFKAEGMYWIECMNDCVITTAQYTIEDAMEIWNRRRMVE